MFRIGVVGSRTGGQHFHTPFISADEGCILIGIVARAEDTVGSTKILGSIDDTARQESPQALPEHH